MRFPPMLAVAVLIGLAMPVAAQENSDNSVDVPQYDSFKSYWGRDKGEKSDSGSSGSGLFGGLFGSSKTHEKFKGKFIATLNSRAVTSPENSTPERTGMQLARREALGEHAIPVPLPSIQTYAKAVLDRLLKGSNISGVTPQVVVIADQQIHGHAFPDGTIFLTLGAIRNLDTEDQLAALLAHELSHIILKHHGSDWFMDGQERGLAALQFALEIREKIEKARGKKEGENTFEDLKMRYIAKSVVFGSQLLIASPFSRTQEDEADLLGTDLLANAGYSIDDMDLMMAKLVSQEKQNLEDAKQRKADHSKVLEDLAGQKEKKGFLDALVGLTDSLFDTITESINDEFGASHAAAQERRDALGEYLVREYDDARPVAAEETKWKKVKDTGAMKALHTGYRHVYQARNAINGDDYDTAVREIQQALKHLGPRHGAPRLTAAIINARAGRFDPAAAYFRQSLAAETPVLSAYASYAELLRRANRPRESEALLKRAALELNDPPQLLPDRIDHARRTLAAQPRQNKAEVAALITRCKLSPLKKLPKFCNDAQKGKYQRLTPLKGETKRALGGPGRSVEITGTSLNVRQGPGGIYTPIAKVRKGMVLSVLDEKNGWLHIRADGGIEGWVSARYTRAATAGLPRKPTRAAPPPRAANSGNIEERLRKAKELHGKGLMTDEEYAAARKKILKSL